MPFEKEKMSEQFKEFKSFLVEYKGFSSEFIQTFMLYALLAEVNERLESIFQKLAELNQKEVLVVLMELISRESEQQEVLERIYSELFELNEREGNRRP